MNHKTPVRQVESLGGLASRAPPRRSLGAQVRVAAFGRNKHAILPQVVFLAGVALLIFFLCRTVLDNLQRLNIGGGFNFLYRQAGFEITQRPVDYDSQATYGRALVVAILNTLILSVVAIVSSTVIGTVVGLIGLARNRLAAGMAAAYVETVRNLPLLLHILFWYFVILRPLPGPRQGIDLFGLVFINNRGLSLPTFHIVSGWWLLGSAVSIAAFWVWCARRWRTGSGKMLPIVWPAAVIIFGAIAAGRLSGSLNVIWDIPKLIGFNIRGGLLLLPEFVAMAVSLSIYASAFIAELVRGGIASVPAGQSEAAQSLGLQHRLIFRLVVLPQALRVIIPPLTNIYLDTVKNSSLGAFVAYPEIMLIYGGTVLNQTNQALEVMTIVILAYLTINMVLSGLMNICNRTILQRGADK